MSDNIHTTSAAITSVTVAFVCECGTETEHVVELDCEEIGPGWVAPPQERFVLCDGCESVIDAGFIISITQPQATT
jgi:hypothetical protein